MLPVTNPNPARPGIKSARNENANSKLDAGEDANGNGTLDTLRDPFQAWFSLTLPPGITATYVDDWLIYHLGNGEVHCSSKVIRAVPLGPKWWSP